jgi:hypothetical protein
MNRASASLYDWITHDGLPLVHTSMTRKVVDFRPLYDAKDSVNLPEGDQRDELTECAPDLGDLFVIGFLTPRYVALSDNSFPVM